MKTDKPTPKKSEWQFFVNAEGYVRYNEKCLMCIHPCKQSHKAKVVICPKYEHRR